MSAWDDDDARPAHLVPVDEREDTWDLPVPETVITAALKAAWDGETEFLLTRKPDGGGYAAPRRDVFERMLRNAAPHIAAAARASERDRLLVSDETLHADGSIGPDEAPPWGGDAAYWYRRWLFAMKQLDKEATERISAYVDMREHLHEVAADAGAVVAEHRIRASERETLAKLCPVCSDPLNDTDKGTAGYWCSNCRRYYWPPNHPVADLIADLIGGTS